MAEDPYATLGLSRTATDDDIRKAFRKLAKKYHPDLHPGDKAAEAKFKALNQAQDLLSDPEKRGKFDRGEIDVQGQPVAPERTFYRDYAQAGASARYQPGMDDMDDVFGSFFRQGAQAGAERPPRRGRDRSYRLEVGFLTAVLGSTERLTLPDGQTLDVRVPPGIEDGQVLRLRGKGEPGTRGGPEGDALIEILVGAHKLYRREGANLVMEVPVTFKEAVLGARVAVPTPGGEVTMTVPPRSDAGTRLRLRGRGVAAHGDLPAGDLYVTLRIVTGPADAPLEAFLRDWSGQAGYDPRAELLP